MARTAQVKQEQGGQREGKEAFHAKYFY